MFHYVFIKIVKTYYLLLTPENPLQEEQLQDHVFPCLIVSFRNSIRHLFFFPYSKLLGSHYTEQGVQYLSHTVKKLDLKVRRTSGLSTISGFTISIIK